MMIIKTDIIWVEKSFSFLVFIFRFLITVTGLIWPGAENKLVWGERYPTVSEKICRSICLNQRYIYCLNWLPYSKNKKMDYEWILCGSKSRNVGFQLKGKNMVYGKNWLSLIKKTFKTFYKLNMQLKLNSSTYFKAFCVWINESRTCTFVRKYRKNCITAGNALVF